MARRLSSFQGLRRSACPRSIASWTLHRLGPRSIEPIPLISLIAVSLSLRLVFEQNLFGYYFMALAVSLVLLEVERGYIRSSFIAWLAMVSIVYAIGPLAVDFFDVARVGEGRTVFPILVILLALLIIIREVVRRGSRWNITIWIAVVVGTLVEWNARADPLSHPLATWFWQIVLVATGTILAAGPLLDRLRDQMFDRDPAPRAAP